MNSTVKTKIGICVKCGPDSKEQPLITDKCKTHYWNYRASVKPVKIKKIGKPIPKVSAKRKIENREYTIKRLQFLAQPENQKCPITGKQTTDVHHKKGRVGSLLLDTRFWLAVSREGHRQIEENPEWAKENNYSLNRI